MTRRRIRVTRLGVRRELTVFLASNLLVIVVIGVVAAFASQSVANEQALDDAERTTNRIGKLVFEPYLPGFLAGDPSAAMKLEEAVANRKIGGRLTELTVWSVEGTVLYSDRSDEIGRRTVPSAEVVAASGGRSVSAFKTRTDVGRAGTDSARAPGYGDRYVEVYVPLLIAGQPPMALEAYFDNQQVDDLAEEILVQSLPLVLGPLLLLGLVQVPVILSLRRRLRQHETERSRLLERALQATELERVRFAADLHDGPIQDLAGIGYALGAIAPGVAPAQGPLMERVQTALTRSVSSLRGLMTDLYPPDLSPSTLGAAFDELARPLRTGGAEVRISLSEVEGVPQDTIASLYRVAREALVNVRKHAGASVVDVTLERPEQDRRAVRLTVADDGIGFAPDRLDRRAEGHLGLRILSERVLGLGGELSLTSAPHEGTTVSAVLPVRAA